MVANIYLIPEISKPQTSSTLWICKGTTVDWRHFLSAPPFMPLAVHYSVFLPWVKLKVMLAEFLGSDLLSLIRTTASCAFSITHHAVKAFTFLFLLAEHPSDAQKEANPFLLSSPFCYLGKKKPTERLLVPVRNSGFVRSRAGLRVLTGSCRVA